jgi:Flp pilus assembly protein TadD
MKDRPGRQQGAVLVEMGSISPHNLTFGLQLQLEQKLFDVFGWPDGEYKLNTKLELATQPVQLDMSHATIIVEGVRRKMTAEALHDVLEPFMDSVVDVHERPLHRFGDLSLEADEREMLTLIDGRRTMRDVVEKCDLPRLQALQLIYALLAAETIQPGRRSRKEERPDSIRPDTVVAPPPLRREPPSLPPAALDNVTVEALRAQLSARVRSMRRMTPHEILGISRSASLVEAQRAFAALTRELLPAQGRALPADARATAEQIRATAQHALETLTDEARRPDLRRVHQEVRTPGTDELSRVLAAETRLRAAEKALHDEMPTRAVSLLREAQTLAPNDAELRAALGWALFERDYAERGNAVDDGTWAEARAELQRALQESPRNARVFVFYGRFLRAIGREDDATTAFQNALRCDPDCADAHLELSRHHPTRAKRISSSTRSGIGPESRP